MPRIVPIQLLRCLKVLLNQNGGILSQAEVQRISCLMTKYSKKLVSKCIYVQILKCTATDLLDEFMRVGGWQLVFIWLNDGIRLANWPLVQEIIELLLLCPVDVNRLKMNSAPKTIKGLSNNGGNEAVRILADRLVKQWLKVVTEGNELARAAATNNATTDTTAVTTTNSATIQTPATAAESQINQATPPTVKIVKSEKPIKNEPEEDPLYVPETFNTTTQLKPSPAQQKGIKSGLVFKIVVKDGQQLLSKVETKPTIAGEDDSVDTNDDDGASSDVVDGDETNVEHDDNANAASAASNIVEDDSTSFDKLDIKDSGESSSESMSTNKTQKERKSSISSDTKADAQDQRKSKDSTKSSSSSSSKEHKSDKDKERKSSSSSHRSSSSTSHKSSSKSSSSSSSSKPKSSSSSSSSSHRSSSDKHRSSSSGSSSKDKSSSSSSKHKSSSKSSSSSSSSSKDRHRDKEREKSSSSSSSSSSANKKDKEREKDLQQAEKDKDTLAKMLPPSLDKLGKIPKKPRLDDKEDSSGAQANSSSVSQKQPTSIIIPSKKASISIEIRRDAEKSSAVKTYKSQFRSHGLTEEAPPPPSRKTLKKPGAAAGNATQSSTHLPTSLPSSSLKRSSPPPPPKEATSSSSASPSTAASGGPPSEKKQKIDINSIVPAAAVAAEKPGAIKIIPPKRIQTLVETNLFSDALSAATGPKKVNKRKRSNASGKDEPTTPTSPDAPKVAPLKFYQDTLDESAKAAAAAAGDDKTKTDNADDRDVSIDKDGNDTISLDDDDDIPLKKVKEDIEKRVRNQKKDDDEASAGAEGEAAIELSDNEEPNGERDAENASPPGVEEARKPGPGCGPDGPPGVLMLHRRKGPKKKLTWRPQESLEQIRYFEMDENERCNVMKVSFLDMKNMERFNERTSLTNMTKRGPRPGDMQEPRTEWRPLIEVDDVPEHPHGAQSKERKVQADREMTTLRALYFSPNMIPDSPSEAELEPHSSMDPPTIPLDDITGNPDAVNDFTDMPWPEPKGTPRNNETAGTGGLGSLGNAADMFGALNAATVPPAKAAGVAAGAGPMSPTNPFSNFLNPFGGNPPPGMVPPNNMMNNGPPMQMMPPNVWQNGGGPPRMPNGTLMNGTFQGPPNPSDMMMGGGGPQRHNFMGQPNGPPGGFNGPPQRQFMGPGNPPPFGPPGFGPNGPNFGPMGPGGPPMGPNGPLMMNNMGPIPPQMNNMGPIPPQMNNMGPVPPQMNSMNHGPNNRNNLNWTHGNSRKRDHNDSWRHGSGSGNNNNGVCKAYMRGNCSVKNCKYLHPKSRR